MSTTTTILASSALARSAPSYLARLSLFVACFFVASTLTSQAALVSLEFDDVSLFGGTLSYAGGPAPLVGTDIVFDQITGVGTPINAGPAGALTIVGGDLDFVTGPSALVAAPTDHVWAGGGSFVLTAADVLDPNSTSIFGGAGSYTLLSGTFTATAFSPGVSTALGNLVFSGLGSDQKNPILEAYFGINEIVEWSFADAQLSSLSMPLDVSAPFSVSVDNSDLINSGDLIPEPTTAILLLAGLLAGASIRNRD